METKNIWIPQARHQSVIPNFRLLLFPKNFVRQVVQFYVNQVFCASDKQYE